MEINYKLKVKRNKLSCVLTRAITFVGDEGIDFGASKASHKFKFKKFNTNIIPHHHQLPATTTTTTDS